MIVLFQCGCKVTAIVLYRPVWLFPFQADQLYRDMLVQLKFFVIIVILLVFGEGIFVIQYNFGYVFNKGVDFIDIAYCMVVLNQWLEILRINAHVEYLYRNHKCKDPCNM